LSKAHINVLRTSFERVGRKIALCSRQKLSEVAERLETLHSSDEISTEIFEKYLKNFSYSPPEILSRANSILLVASPIGRSILQLSLEEGHFDAVIPPTYGSDELIKENEAILDSILSTDSIGFARAWVPLKSLGANTGLGRYGRDNILRFEGAGSFVRLDAWWTELEEEGEYWGPARELERCATCGACVKACPNGCFSENKFLIDAAKCLTFMNEGSMPFPAWIHPDLHNAAVGCLRCQDTCPENRNTPGLAVYRRFILDREASESLLEGKPCAELPASAAAAVRAAEMVGSEKNLARNLHALIAAKGFSQSSLARA
jgi:epoxyqueuosine reductase